MFDVVTQPVRTVVSGTGKRFLYRHLPALLDPANSTEITALFDPCARAAERAAALCHAAGQNPVVVYSFEELRAHGADAAVVASPNAEHFTQTMAFLERGLSVLLEKPPTITVDEAIQLADTASQAGALVVCSFQGSLSNERDAARELVATGGGIRTITGVVQESWFPAHLGTWRVDVSVSGGGFLFDSGSHLVHAVVDLGGPVRDVTARLRYEGDVEVSGAAVLTLENGAVASLSWCGDVALDLPRGYVEVVCADRLVRTGIWGRSLEVADGDGERIIAPPPGLGPWAQLLASLQTGHVPFHASLRMWVDVMKVLDAIFESGALRTTVELPITRGGD